MAGGEDRTTAPGTETGLGTFVLSYLTLQGTPWGYPAVVAGWVLGA